MLSCNNKDEDDDFISRSKNSKAEDSSEDEIEDKSEEEFKVLLFDSPLDVHVKSAFYLYYKKNYPGSDSLSLYYPDKSTTEPEIARSTHGIQHTTRVAINVLIFTNLYRYFESKKHKKEKEEKKEEGIKYKASELTHEEIRLLQIAALLHDSAREDDDEDLWDKESASNFYKYIIDCSSQDKGLNGERKKRISQLALTIAEAIANKDAPKKVNLDPSLKDKNVYLKIQVKTNNDPIIYEGRLVWKETTDIPPKNIYQKLIGNSDCLDIIRARDSFMSEYLDFYNDFVKDNPEAIEILSLLIHESASIIDLQGDGRGRLRPTIKKQYEHEDAYQSILKCYSSSDVKLDSKNNLATIDPRIFYKLVPRLSHELLSMTELNSLIAAAIQSDFKNDSTRELLTGNIYARGIPFVACIRNKDKTSAETMAHLELYKTDRRKGVPTRTMNPDKDRLNKSGNISRSITQLYRGTPAYASAGFLIIDPDLAIIKRVSFIDANTGRGKKKNIKGNNLVTIEEKKQQLSQLLEYQKLMGRARDYGNHVSKHNEVIADIHEFTAIYYTLDPTVVNEFTYGNAYPLHQHCPRLEAIFLEYEYMKSRKSNKKLSPAQKRNQLLPIYEYSGLHGYMIARQFNEDEIMRMWIEMCGDYIKNQLNSGEDGSIYKMSLETMKINAMYKTVEVDRTQLVKRNASADSNYPQGLKKRIDLMLEKERKKLITEKRASLFEKIQAGRDIFSLEYSDYVALLNSKMLLQYPIVVSQIQKAVHEQLKGKNQSVMGDLYNEFQEIMKLSAPSKKVMNRYSYLLSSACESDKLHLIKVLKLSKASQDKVYAQIVQPFALKIVKYKLKEWQKLFETSLTTPTPERKDSWAIFDIPDVSARQETFMSDFSVDELRKFIYYAEWFELPTVKNTLNDFIKKILNHALQKFYAGYASKIALIVKTANEYGLLLGPEFDSLKESLVQFTLTYGETLMAESKLDSRRGRSVFGVVNRNCYFSLAQELNIPIEEQRIVFINYIKLNHSIISRCDLAEILKKHPLIKNVDLFEMFFNEIEFKPRYQRSEIIFKDFFKHSEAVNEIEELFRSSIVLSDKHNECISSNVKKREETAHFALIQSIENTYDSQVFERIDSLSYFLKFSKKIKTPIDIQQAILTKWISTIEEKNESITTLEIDLLILAIKGTEVDLSYNIHLLEILVNRVSLKNDHGEYKIEECISAVNSLKELMPNNIFDEKQIYVVQKAIVEKKKELLLIYLTSTDSTNALKLSTDSLSDSTSNLELKESNPHSLSDSNSDLERKELNVHSSYISEDKLQELSIHLSGTDFLYNDLDLFSKLLNKISPYNTMGAIDLNSYQDRVSLFAGIMPTGTFNAEQQKLLSHQVENIIKKIAAESQTSDSVRINRLSS